jgi:hypothetical protein
MELWSWTLEGIGLIGAYFVGRKRWQGWIVMILASVLWIVFGLKTHQYGFTVASMAFLGVYSRNLRAWRADPSPAEPVSPLGHQPGSPATGAAKSTSVSP